MKKLVKTGYKKFLNDIVAEIGTAQKKAYQSVNRHRVELYWYIGGQLHSKVEVAKWGESVIEKLSEDLRLRFPKMKGFSERNLWNMKQFYETYKDIPKLQKASAEICWSNNVLIISSTKSLEEKEFYVKMSAQERWSFPELKRQIDSCLVERWALCKSKKGDKLIPHTKESDPVSHFRDEYNLGFLSLEEPFSEKDLQKAIVRNLRDFFLEFGKNLAFVGEEYPVRVGNSDFRVDLLFYHRDLRSLVAVELKLEKFMPEYIGKMQFYLNALDEKLKLEHENPSVGLILCKTKDDEIVRIAISNNNKQMKVSTYQIIDQKLLKRKIHSLPVPKDKK